MPRQFSKVSRAVREAVTRKNEQIELLQKMIKERDEIIHNQVKLANMMKAREKALLNYIVLNHDPTDSDT